MADKFTLTICIYFTLDADIFPLRNIVEFTDRWSMHVDKKIEHISFSFIDDKGKYVNKNLKYKEKNLNVMYQIEKSKKLKGAGVFNLSENAYFKYKDLDLSMNFSIPSDGDRFDLYALNFQFNLDVFNIKDNKSFFVLLEELLSFLKNIKATLKYGIIFPFEKAKLPFFYASGISSQGLTKEEEHKAHLWGHYGDQCKQKVWNIFWGNILTKKHLASDAIINDIKGIVGENNLRNIDQDTFLITYPLSVFNFDKEREDFNKYDLRLTELFERYNLMIREPEKPSIGIEEKVQKETLIHIGRKVITVDELDRLMENRSDEQIRGNNTQKIKPEKTFIEWITRVVRGLKS